MTMPPPVSLPPPPTATPTPTPTVPGPMMTPAQETVAPPAVPSPPEIPAKLRAGEMPVPEQPPEKLNKWEFFAAKHQLPLSVDYPVEEQAFGIYQGLSAGERKAFDAEWEEYYYGITPEGEGVAPPLLSPNEERMLIDLQNAVKIGEKTEDQAWDIIANYWSKEQTQTRRAEDATRRGETLLAGAHPGPNLPMTGPGGMGAALAEKWGGPNLMPAVPGMPGSQALDMFGQAQEQLGLPPQLPPLEPPQFQLPNWQALGQAMPTFGGNNYFDQLLKEGRMTAPGL